MEGHGRNHADRTIEEPPPYQTLGAPVAAERVLQMQADAQDIDQTILEQEDPLFATAAATTLHPFHALLTKPTRGGLPGILPYKTTRSESESDSPNDITTPLFLQPQVADGWGAQNRSTENAQPNSTASVVSVTSSLVRRTPSLVGSSIVLSIKDAHEQCAKPTWAPMPPPSSPGPGPLF